MEYSHLLIILPSQEFALLYLQPDKGAVTTCQLI